MDVDDSLRPRANAELVPGDFPSKKARLSTEFNDARKSASSGAGRDATPVSPQGDVHDGSKSSHCDFGGNIEYKQLVFIELCARSAVLSSVAQKHGYRVMPVDRKRNRHKPRCQIVALDLADDHAWEVLEYILDTCDVAAVHMAPPLAKQGGSLYQVGSRALSHCVPPSSYYICLTFRKQIKSKWRHQTASTNGWADSFRSWIS